MKLLIILCCLSVATNSIAQELTGRHKNYNLKKNVALEGYDPVSYFNGEPQEGKATLQFLYLGVVYYFANIENLTLFKNEPNKYEPQFGGWCAFAIGETGEKIKIDPKTYKIINEKLYLFYNFRGVNTLTSWNLNEKNLLKKADENWVKLNP